jgi:hypothetical protein
LRQHCDVEHCRAKEELRVLWSKILVSCSEQPHWVSLEFPDKQLHLLLTGRCEINQKNSVNIPENSSHNFPWRLHCLENLFDWRVRMLPGHRFCLATTLLENVSPCYS